MDREAKKLYIQLVNRGEFAKANALKAAWESPRVGRGELGERGELLARGRQIGLDREDLFVPKESAGSKFIADMGAEFVDQGLGINQLTQHLMPGKNTEDIDQRVLDARKTYEESGLADETTGGRFAGAVVPGLAGGVVGRTALAARPVWMSMGMGATEEAIRPVADENYWTEKAKDVLAGTTVGLVTEGVPGSAVRATEEFFGAPQRLQRQLFEKGSKTDGPGLTRADQAEIDANLALQEATGIQFTPGQITQAGSLQQVEELARTNLFTRNQVARGDLTRAQQYREAITEFRKSLGDDAPIETVAPKLQAWGDERAKELIKARADQADIDYRPVQSWADGRPVLEATNYENELHRIVARGDAASATEDQIRAGRQAEERLDRLYEQGGKLTGRDIEQLTRATEEQQQQDKGGPTN